MTIATAYSYVGKRALCWLLQWTVGHVLPLWDAVVGWRERVLQSVLDGGRRVRCAEAFCVTELRRQTLYQPRILTVARAWVRKCVGLATAGQDFLETWDRAAAADLDPARFPPEHTFEIVTYGDGFKTFRRLGDAASADAAADDAAAALQQRRRETRFRPGHAAFLYAALAQRGYKAIDVTAFMNRYRSIFHPAHAVLLHELLCLMYLEGVLNSRVLHRLLIDLPGCVLECMDDDTLKETVFQSHEPIRI
jgi:hypothetical protein